MRDTIYFLVIDDVGTVRVVSRIWTDRDEALAAFESYSAQYEGIRLVESIFG